MFFNLAFYLISLLIACFCLFKGFILYSLFLTLQDDFYGLKIIKGER
ncbi:putative membrane protein [Helicobacter pylori Hp A-16]|nr:putative membrane protein [Helicobacter pylori Hp A-16]